MVRLDFDHWGTKWNACDAEYSNGDPQHVLWFDTAWAPPEPVFEVLAKQFQAHEIVVRPLECENHRQDTFTLKDGKVSDRRRIQGRSILLAAFEHPLDVSKHLKRASV